MAQRVMTADMVGSDLLFLLGEELKQPLITIMQMAELGDKDVLIRAQAQRALHTIDNVLMYKKLASGQLSLHPEPVHVGSTVTQVAATIDPQMQMSGCRTEIDIQHSLQTVHIDRRLLRGALLGMWQAFIGTIQDPSEVTCTALKVPNGVRLSIVSSGAEMDTLALSAANDTSSQPIVGFAGPAADLVTAQRMFGLIGARVTKSHKGTKTGIGVTLPVSKQMQLV